MTRHWPAALWLLVLWLGVTGTAFAQPSSFELMPQLGHTEAVRCVAFSPDGRLALSGGESFRVWDAQSGLLLRSLPGHNGTVSAIVPLPGTSQVLTGGYDSIRVWDLRTGELVRSFAGPAGHVKVLAVSGDGRRIASSGDRRVRLWDATPGRLERTLEGHTERVTSIALSPDGNTLVSAAEDYSIRIWDVPSGKSRVIRTGGLSRTEKRRGAIVKSYHGHVIAAVAYSPTEPLFASAAADGVTLWNPSTGTKVRTLKGHDWTGSKSLAFSADGRRLVSGGGDKTVRIYEPSSGALLQTLPGHSLRVSAVALSPDGRQVLSGSGDKSLRLWNADTGKHLWTFRGYMDSLEAVAISPNGKLALAASGKNAVGTGPKPPIYLWSLERGALLRELVDHTEHVYAVAFSPDSRRALSGAGDEAMVLWDVERGQPIRRFVDWSAGGGKHVRGAVMGVKAVAFAQQGRLGVAGCGDGGLRVWDLQGGELLRTLRGSAEPITAVAVLPDGRRAVSASWDKTARLWDLETGAELRRFEGHRKWVVSVSLSADGRRLLTGSSDRRAKLWDVDTGKLVRTIEPPRGQSYLAALSPDGRLAALSVGQAIALVDVRTGAERALWRGHHGHLSSLTFSADGERVLSSSVDGTVRLWRVDGGASLSLSAVGGDWLVSSDDGYFDASRQGGRLAAAVSGMRGFRIDQLAIRNNRPDLLLQRLGLGTPLLLDHFRALHRRRVQRFGLDEGQLLADLASAPSVQILGAEQRGRHVELRLALAARGRPLKSYQIFVNAVPLFGAAGKPVPADPSSITEQVELGAGTNKIEVSALDQAGLESLRRSRVFQHDEPVVGDLYFLGFGISRYRDQRLNLGFAHKDVLDMAALLQHAQGTFRQVHVQTHVDEQVTRGAIEKAKAFFDSAKVDDTVVLMVAGHGSYGAGVAAPYYFVTYDTDVSRLAQTAAPFERLEELLQGIAPRRKLFLLDTCESGERDEATARSAASRAGQRGLSARTARALVLEHDGAAQPRPFLFDRDRYIYYDLLRRSGAIVLSSSTGAEISYEQDALQNGVFTEELLRALTSSTTDQDGDGRISIPELRRQVTRAVADRTGGLQHPVIDRDNPEIDLTLPILPASALPAEPAGSSSEPGRLPPHRMGCFCTLEPAGAPGRSLPLLSWLVLLLLAAQRRPSTASRRWPPRSAQPDSQTPCGPDGVWQKLR